MTDFILKIDNFQVKMDFFQVNNHKFGLKRPFADKIDRFQHE